MGLTNYPNGVLTPHVVSPGLSGSTGKVFYVNNGTVHAPKAKMGSDGGGSDGSYNAPYATLQHAIDMCVANRGDIIRVCPSHTEVVSTSGGITVNKAGVIIEGLGAGNLRPIFWFSALTTASMIVSASNVKISNIIGKPGVDSVSLPFTVTGDNCELDIEWQDASATVEAVCAVRLDTANNCKLRLKYLGFVTGNALVDAVRLDDCDNVWIDIDGYGICTTAWVDMIDAASTNVHVTGAMYTSGITNFSRDVVDTITNSTWSAEIFDASFGGKISGGSGAALAADDVSAVAAAVANVQTQVNKLDALTLAVDPTAGSLARFIASGGTALGTQLPASTSLYDIIAGAGGIPTFPAAAAPANTVSMAEVLRAIYNQTLATGIHSVNPNYLPITVDFADAAWNTVATHEVLTVTGMVQLTIIPQVAATLTDAADLATLQLGIAGTTNAIIATTGAAGVGGDTLATNEFWLDATPADVVVTKTALDNLTVVVGAGLDVGFEVAGEALTGGRIIFHVWWTPLDATGAVVGGTGVAL